MGSDGGEILEGGITAGEFVRQGLQPLLGVFSTGNVGADPDDPPASRFDQLNLVVDIWVRLLNRHAKGLCVLQISEVVIADENLVLEVDTPVTAQRRSWA